MSYRRNATDIRSVLVNPPLMAKKVAPSLTTNWSQLNATDLELTTGVRIKNISATAIRVSYKVTDGADLTAESDDGFYLAQNEEVLVPATNINRVYVRNDAGSSTGSITYLAT